MTGAGGAKPFEIYDIAFADGPGVYDLSLQKSLPHPRRVGSLKRFYLLSTDPGALTPG